MRGVKKQRSPGGNVLSDDGANSSRSGEHGFGGGRHVVSADGGLMHNVRAVVATPPSSAPSKPSVFGKVGCRTTGFQITRA